MSCPDPSVHPRGCKVNLSPGIERAESFEFDRVADAFRRLETGHLRGNVVITAVSPDSGTTEP